MGVIASGTGVAACVLKPLAGKLINPNGLVAVEGAFPDAVYARWPPVLRVLGLLCGILTVIGGFLQTNPPSFAGSYPARDRLARVAELALARLTRGAAPTPCKQKLRGQSGSTLPTARPRQALGQAPAAVGFSRRLGVMWLMILTSAASGLSIASTYRVIGRRHPHLDSDSFLSVVGGHVCLDRQRGRPILLGPSQRRPRLQDRFPRASVGPGSMHARVHHACVLSLDVLDWNKSHALLHGR